MSVFRENEEHVVNSTIKPSLKSYVMDLSALTMFDGTAFTESVTLDVDVNFAVAYSGFYPADLSLLREEHLYLEMFADKALFYASPYLLDEHAQIMECLGRVQRLQQQQGSETSLSESLSMVVIGAGPLLHLSAARHFDVPYVAVDPCIHHHVGRLEDMQEHRISLQAVAVQELNAALLPETPRLYVLPFNVIAYIDNPLEELQRLIRPGDSLYLSTWNDRDVSANCHRAYQRALTEHGCAQDSLKRFDLNSLDFSKLPGVRSVHKMSGGICDSLFLQW